MRHLATRWNATVTAHALVGACRAGDEDAAETLLERVEKAAPPENNAANPESPEARKARVRAFVSQVARHTTPMHAAAESGSVPVARMLLERGASPDARRPDDDATPLFCAARHGRPGMIAFLFSQGADIEALCKTADRREGHDSVTPLVEAVMSDQAAAAARLIALGADVRAPTSWMPPLLTATLRSNATITRMLLREGADPRCGVGGMTPLGLAVMTRQSELVKALLDWRGGEETGAGNGDGKNGKEKEKEKEKETPAGSSASSRRTRGKEREKEKAPADADSDSDGPPDLVSDSDSDAESSERKSRNEKEKGGKGRAGGASSRGGGSRGAPPSSRGDRKYKDGALVSSSSPPRVDPDEPIDAAVLEDGADDGAGCGCAACARGRAPDSRALDSRAGGGFDPDDVLCSRPLDGPLGRAGGYGCLLYTSPSPRDQRGSRMPSSA